MLFRATLALASDKLLQVGKTSHDQLAWISYGGVWHAQGSLENKLTPKRGWIYTTLFSVSFTLLERVGCVYEFEVAARASKSFFREAWKSFENRGFWKNKLSFQRLCKHKNLVPKSFFFQEFKRSNCGSRVLAFSLKKMFRAPPPSIRQMIETQEGCRWPGGYEKVVLRAVKISSPSVVNAILCPSGRWLGPCEA